VPANRAEQEISYISERILKTAEIPSSSQESAPAENRSEPPKKLGINIRDLAEYEKSTPVTFVDTRNVVSS